MRNYKPIELVTKMGNDGSVVHYVTITPRLSVVGTKDQEWALGECRKFGYYPTGRKDIFSLAVEVARGRPYAIWCRLGWWVEESFWTVTRLSFRMGLWHRKYWSPGERLRWRDVRPGPSRKK